MKKARFTDPQVMVVLAEAQSGVAVPAGCCRHSISSASFYKWRAQHWGHGLHYDGSDEDHGR